MEDEKTPETTKEHELEQAELEDVSGGVLIGLNQPFKPSSLTSLPAVQEPQQLPNLTEIPTLGK
ncbi:MAG: hypothetical protein WBX15_14210 [Thermoanaerobaculia bacterium]